MVSLHSSAVELRCELRALNSSPHAVTPVPWDPTTVNYAESATAAVRWRT